MTQGTAGPDADANRARDGVGTSRLLNGSMAVLVVVLVVVALATMANPSPRVWLGPIGVIFLAEALAGSGALTHDQEQAARVAVARMRAMKAPDPAWSDMRDDYVRQCLRWIDTPRDETHAEEWAAINDDFESLHPRRLELVEQTR